MSMNKSYSQVDMIAFSMFLTLEKDLLERKLLNTGWRRNYRILKLHNGIQHLNIILSLALKAVLFKVMISEIQRIQSFHSKHMRNHVLVWVSALIFQICLPLVLLMNMWKSGTLLTIMELNQPWSVTKRQQWVSFSLYHSTRIFPGYWLQEDQRVR